ATNTSTIPIAKVAEASAQLRPLGVGINVLPHAVGVLSGLGLADAMAALAIPTREVAFYTRHGQRIWADGRGLEAGYPFPQYSVHRGELQMLLYRTAVERLGPDRVLTGQRLVRFEQDAHAVRARLESKDGVGTTHRADVMLAADGIHSAARRQLYPDEGVPRWSRLVLYRGVTRSAPFLSGRTMVQMGNRAQKFVCYPISRAAYDEGASLTNWIACVQAGEREALKPEDWNRRAEAEAFLPRYAGWRFPGLELADLVRGADDIFEFPMVDRDPLPRWTFDRVTLLGDAAHPMYPIGSNGATQAIMDAQALADAFAAHGTDWRAALARYEGERRAATHALTLANRREGLDRILDVVDERAPDGFDDLETVLPARELEAIVSEYKTLAGHHVAFAASKGGVR
ncbi:MAG TPA: flavin-dependent oxidoreductase, partial [Burkholderiaceae bacterium]|nr:flavin-dependent oxidoreductase [Burkholderiaceae bacterium]